MKAASLLFLRVSTGLLIIIWGIIKIGSPESAIKVSNFYYNGSVSAEALQMPFGLFQILIGALVILGLFRKFVYPVQALILCIGAVVIWRYLVDPLGLIFFDEDTRRTLFFPSLGIAAATLVTWAFMDEDRLSLDAKLAGRKN